MSRSFRVLWIDDQLYESWLALGEDWRTKLDEIGGDDPTADVFRRLVRLADEATAFGCPLDAYLAGSLQFGAGQGPRPITGAAAWKPEFLNAMDVVVLDLAGLSVPPPEWKLTHDDLRKSAESAGVQLDPSGPSQEDLDYLNGPDASGAAFYLKLRTTALASCRAVVILSSHDGSKKDAVVRFLEPYCSPDSIPWTVKHPRTRAGVDLAADQIEALYRDFAAGYTDLTSRGAIEFAASHDLPVLIVGETGTGKEYLARAIHRRWLQEKLRAGATNIASDLAVVNCAGLSPALARGDLFGWVRDAFTSATDHSIGKVLQACGVPPISSQPTRFAEGGWSEDFKRRLLRTGRVAQEGDGVHLVGSGPFGTLFLDEFADLPMEVQALLLRFLESGSAEIEPLGFLGRISGARVRIITATSDPRVAHFVGHPLVGSWRSREELDRPLRQDLLFRVKGQVIRTMPIDAKNVNAAIRHFVDRRPDVPWTESAINRLSLLLERQIEDVQRADAAARQVEEGGKAARFAAFGHRREVDRMVLLANAYVRGARLRGLRGISEVVTPKIIDKLWAPSAIDTTHIDAPLKSRGSEPAFSLDATEAERARALRNEIEEMWKSIGVALPEAWNAEVLAEYQGKLCRGALEGVTGVSKQWKTSIKKLLATSNKRKKLILADALGEALPRLDDEALEKLMDRKRGWFRPR